MKRKTKRTYRRRRSSVSGFSVPKKVTTTHLTFAGGEILAETAIDHFTGGFLTDETGRWAKILGGLGLLVTQKSEKVQGIGIGLALNNGFAKFGSKENKTLGDTVKEMVLPASSVAAIRPYNRSYINGVNGIGPLNRETMIENFV